MLLESECSGLILELELITPIFLNLNEILNCRRTNSYIYMSNIKLGKKRKRRLKVQGMDFF